MPDSLTSDLVARGVTNISLQTEATTVAVENLPAAAIFIFAAWSGPAKAGLRKLADAIASSGNTLQLVVLDNDVMNKDWIWNYVAKETWKAYPFHGNAECVWVKHGRVIDISSYLHLKTESEIIQLIDRCL